MNTDIESLKLLKLCLQRCCAAATGYQSKSGNGPAATAGPHCSDFYRLGDRERIFEFDAEVTHRAVHLRVAKKELHRPQVAGLLIYVRDLRAPHGIGAIRARLKANGCHLGSGPIDFRLVA